MSLFNIEKSLTINMENARWVITADLAQRTDCEPVVVNGSHVTHKDVTLVNMKSEESPVTKKKLAAKKSLLDRIKRSK